MVLVPECCPTGGVQGVCRRYRACKELHLPCKSVSIVTFVPSVLREELETSVPLQQYTCCRYHDENLMSCKSQS